MPFTVLFNFSNTPPDNGDKALESVTCGIQQWRKWGMKSVIKTSMIALFVVLMIKVIWCPLQSFLDFQNIPRNGWDKSSWKMQSIWYSATAMHKSGLCVKPMDQSHLAMRWAAKGFPGQLSLWTCPCSHHFESQVTAVFSIVGKWVVTQGVKPHAVKLTDLPYLLLQLSTSRQRFEGHFCKTFLKVAFIGDILRKMQLKVCKYEE